MEEATVDSGRYAQLKTRKRDDSFHIRNGFTNLSPPIDTYNTVYLSFILGGAGFLFPYNRYVPYSLYYTTYLDETYNRYNLTNKQTRLNSF